MINTDDAVVPSPEENSALAKQLLSSARWHRRNGRPGLADSLFAQARRLWPEMTVPRQRGRPGRWRLQIEKAVHSEMETR